MDERHAFSVGKVKLVPVLADIRELDADAVVQPSGTSPTEVIQASPWVIHSDSDGLVAASLAKHAPLQLGEVIITSAGSLKARYLFSAVVLDWAHQHPSNRLIVDEIVTATAQRCISIANALNLKTIAFTPWGTRVGASEASQITALMLNSITVQLQSVPGSLETVYLISNNQKHYEWFVDRAFVFHLLFDQVSQIRSAINELDIPQARRDYLINLLENLQTNVVVYNEIIGGDKIDVGDISGTTGVAIGRESEATVDPDE